MLRPAPFASVPRRVDGTSTIALPEDTGTSLARAYVPGPLPETWPDRAGARLFFSLLRAPFVKGGEVMVPDDLPGPPVPDYARRPFHGLPNGYYSHNVAQGYDTGFEVSMLGRISRARNRILQTMLETPGGAKRVLDVGCGSGRLAAALAARGVEEVWGVDPSPYLLQIAAGRTQKAKFLQGTVENLPFADASFDAVGACFLFHELPRVAAEKGILQLLRVLRPGGTLVIVDPCRDHVRPKSLLRLVLKHGLGALYFHFLARGVYEPFLDDWHGLGDHAAWLRDHGFVVEEDEVTIPLQFLVARRPLS